MNLFSLIHAKSFDNTYFLLLHPDVTSLSEVIQAFNQSNKDNINGVVLSDLVFLTGNRKGRYVCGRIVDGKIDASSFTESEVNPEMLTALDAFYAQLSDGAVSRIYPISLRNHIKSLKAH